MIGIANIFLAPANSIVTNLFPDFSNLVSTFTTFINTYIGNGVLYFFSILPPNTKTFIILYLYLLVILYTASLAIHVLIKVIEIIKAVKIW